jgi:hypothetical protein
MKAREVLSNPGAKPSALEVYAGSDGALTTRYYAELSQRGPIGLIALNLFRAQKCSTRAKKYRGGIRGHGSYKSMAYDRKSWSMGNLSDALIVHASKLGMRWGWKEDPSTPFGEQSSYVLYVDLPQGQVSFHSPTRGKGPEYPAEFDGEHKSEERILAFCDSVHSGVSYQKLASNVEPAVSDQSAVDEGGR